MGTTAEVVALREQVADLTLMLAGQGKKREYEERVERLQVHGFTKIQAKILATFNGSRVWSSARIMDAIYWDNDDPPDIEIIKVHICKIRKKLEIHGIKIETVWATGYQISPECYTLLRRLIEPKETDDGRKEEERVSCACS